MCSGASLTSALQYHDYALVVFFLQAVCIPVSGFACSPIDFIRNPLLWADMIDKFEATHTAGPNFSYGLLANRMRANNRKLKNTGGLLRANIAAEPIAPLAAIVTKLDEAKQPLPALEHAQGGGLGIAFLTNGPDLGPHFFRADAERFADLALIGRIG